MTEEVLKYIETENLIEKGDLVIAGVSGGADSVCLLRVLEALRWKIGFWFGAVHVEHGIRGEESRQDAVFVSELCQKWKVPFRIFHVQVLDYAKQNGMGIEEAARTLRYDCYRRAAEEGEFFPEQSRRENAADIRNSISGKVKIALAHHAQDNAETILFQLIRGSGIDGLCGMKKKRPFTDSAVIIRPMLSIPRERIESYLKEIGQDFRTDATNFDTEYSRNKIRNLILPELLQINRQAVEHINHSADILQEVSSYLENQVDGYKESVCIFGENEIVILKKEAEELPEILQKELIRRVIREAANAAKDITSVHIEAVCQLFSQQVGKQLALPYHLAAERVYEGVRIGKRREEEPFCQEFTLEVTREQLERAETGEELFFTVPEGKIRIRILDFQGKMQEISKKTYTKWINYDKIKNSLQIRNRRSGDYLIIDDAGHTKRLKEYFIHEKIPERDRGGRLLLTDGKHVLWVIGGRLSAGIKIEKGTSRVLEIQICGGKYNEN